MATRATAGYAYLIQLVGYHVWQAAWLRCRDGEDKVVISEQDARKGVTEAEEEFRDAVLETAIWSLPKTAIDFVMAMSEGRDVVAMSAIVERLGKTTGYLNPYRRQLIVRQVIERTVPGYVTFSIPFMREFLHARRGAILARYGE